MNTSIAMGEVLVRGQGAIGENILTLISCPSPFTLHPLPGFYAMSHKPS